MKKECPGAANIKGSPTLEIKKCPECGGGIEIFSTDTQAACPVCGFTAYNDLNSCIQWCRFAEECVGEDVLKKMRK